MPGGGLRARARHHPGNRARPRLDLAQVGRHPVLGQGNRYLFPAHGLLAQEHRQNELIAAKPSIAIDVGQRPDLGQRHLGQLALHENTSSLGSGQVARASAIIGIENLRVFALLSSLNGPFSLPVEGIEVRVIFSLN